MSLMSLPNWFRAFNGASPNVVWMNLSIETSSICTCEMKFFLANGEITSIGTLGPKP